MKSHAVSAISSRTAHTTSASIMGCPRTRRRPSLRSSARRVMQGARSPYASARAYRRKALGTLASQGVKYPRTSPRARARRRLPPPQHFTARRVAGTRPHAQAHPPPWTHAAPARDDSAAPPRTACASCLLDGQAPRPTVRPQRRGARMEEPACWGRRRRAPGGAAPRSAPPVRPRPRTGQVLGDLRVDRARPVRHRVVLRDLGEQRGAVPRRAHQLHAARDAKSGSLLGRCSRHAAPPRVRSGNGETSG